MEQNFRARARSCPGKDLDRMPTTMKAAVVRKPGGPEVLEIEQIPLPVPAPGWVLIRVKAFGLNRSELFTRRGLSPDVQFPRVLGIEAVGIVARAPAGEFQAGETVATVMGGVGRDFDGGYAEFTCVPATQVQSVRSSLPWEIIGAVPRNAPDGMALFVSQSSPSKRRTVVDPRWDDVGRARSCDHREIA